tara:strand:- start:717 stop:1061 length:345 start_codon:yes stop_codon:yes gene_type:complete
MTDLQACLILGQTFDINTEHLEEISSRLPTTSKLKQILSYIEYHFLGDAKLDELSLSRVAFFERRYYISFIIPTPDPHEAYSSDVQYVELDFVSEEKEEDLRTALHEWGIDYEC